jgi:ubiquinone/menaquinone biosynthesis C-methylase UbiE
VSFISLPLISKAGRQLGGGRFHGLDAGQYGHCFPIDRKSYHGEGVIIGVYERWIVPRLLDLAMRNRLLDDYRQRTIRTARGLVLEVGIGSGLNLPLYGPAVTRVVAIDPSPELLRLASKRTVDAVVPVSLIRASAEHLPFANAVFDTTSRS